MQTTQDYINNPSPVMWLHGLDALDYILNGPQTTAGTAYKGEVTADNFRHLEVLKREMEELPEPNGFADLAAGVEWSRPRRRPVRAQEGEFDLDLYLDREPECFWDYVKDPQTVQAVTIILEFNIPYDDRFETYIADRHQKVYKLALEAEAQGLPCRVVAAKANDIGHAPGYPKGEVFRSYIVLKDYSDPIFPGLWGGLKNNLAANSFANCLWDFIVGSWMGGNAHQADWNISQDFPEDEELILIEPKRLSK
jgi:hypothetical protein